MFARDDSREEHSLSAFKAKMWELLEDTLRRQKWLLLIDVGILLTFITGSAVVKVLFLP